MTQPDVKIRPTHARRMNTYDALSEVDDRVRPFSQYGLSGLDVDESSHLWSSRKRQDGKCKAAEAVSFCVALMSSNYCHAMEREAKGMARSWLQDKPV